MIMMSEKSDFYKTDEIDKMTDKDIGDLKINFTIKWKCSEEKLLEKCKLCEDYSELLEVLNENMILNIRR